MPWVWRMDGFQMRPSQHPANGMRPLDHSMQGACDIQISLVICVLLQDVYNNYWLEQHLNLFKENVNFIRWWCNFLEKSKKKKKKQKHIKSRNREDTVIFVWSVFSVALTNQLCSLCVFMNLWLSADTY